MQISAAALAQMIGAALEGDPDVMITGPARIEEAGQGQITFLANPAYEHHLYGTEAAAVLVSRQFQPKNELSTTLLRVDNVYETVRGLLEIYQQDEATKTVRQVSQHACVEDDAQLGKDVRVGKFTVISSGARIGASTVVLDQVFIGPNVRIGEHCTIYPGARILRDCVIGNHCVLHPNVVIGADGFGFLPDGDNHYRKIPQVGNVIIEDHVEIGSNTTIDRATMGSTLIRQGVKLDNLIQIGHNVEIGNNTVIAAQAGVAGSTKIGANCRIGGQVGFAGHLTIADGTNIQAQSGIARHIREPNQALAGSPAFGYRDWIKSSLLHTRLPELYKRIARLEKKLEP
ncbi:UDP-3-O-[3-hydroxymyristoyl] glucosamine N-acyltransferase [Lewinella marina]|uniref:UDP-3-O-acylglucosamine N-acyltransferase n=1 Tax=Neolewinella marina TaxID=438751 RepID=A0A2G0CCQ9_9BACT|nr:UDP-3-O-(3-hydroxymyristoyl)glucosamine N-acyltransferase [Neolewinella marina]NJB87589.1 UDP-3-O-[3-hydroxymyristoyl] glucosamine N-acyltransferase [Neolewinella marina]PHK97720.1 UDP-3-O-(3-hydroxymyristoyl)glucosamine N-acyltransferase [Neolewinella marina]